MNAPATIGHVWVKVENGPYEVNAFGGVRREGGKPLRPRVQSNGYHRVSLGAGNDRYVHRLVCQAFHGAPPLASWHADHINGVRSDNRATNLRWMSPEDNRASRRFRRGEDSPGSKLTEEIVKFIKAQPRTRGSDLALAEKFGVSRENVRDIRTGKGWTHVK